MLIRATAHAARLLVVLALLSAPGWPQQQQMSSLERGRALEILQVVSADLKKHYYDPKFHGVDLDAKLAEAKQQIEKVNSFNMAMSHVAAVLDSLNDSHTFFIPPQHAYRRSLANAVSDDRQPLLRDPGPPQE